MKAKVYFETTIPSYLVSKPSRDMLVATHQQLTRKWWSSRRSLFDLYVSEMVLLEARAGDSAAARRRLDVLKGVPVLTMNREILELAEALMAEGPIPRKASVDASHVALATVHQCEYLLTWNCRHIANAEFYSGIRRVARDHGYEVPTLCTPEGLMGFGL